MDKDKADVVKKMVFIFEIHKDFVHERLCKRTPEIETLPSANLLCRTIILNNQVIQCLIKEQSEQGDD